MWYVGYWLAVAQRERGFAVTYIDAERDAGRPYDLRFIPRNADLVCSSGANGMLRSDARSDLIAIHPLKTPCSIAYAWNVVSSAQAGRRLWLETGVEDCKTCLRHWQHSEGSDIGTNRINKHC